MAETHATVTIRDVSERAKVSISTVSRVLNGTVPVAEQTRQRVLQAVKELDYRPNVFAPSLGDAAADQHDRQVSSEQLQHLLIG